MLEKGVQMHKVAIMLAFAVGIMIPAAQAKCSAKTGGCSTAGSCATATSCVTANCPTAGSCTTAGTCQDGTGTATKKTAKPKSTRRIGR